MKAVIFAVLFTIASIECRRVLKPLDKNANLDFINMESGGFGGGQAAGRPTGSVPAPAPAPAKAPAPAPAPAPASPQPAKSPSPAPVPTTAKPAAPVPTQPPTQPKPAQGIHTQMDLKPVQPAKPAAGGPTTPGHGNVQQLITYYDSQGKASVIRPYSYSQAVKQG